MPHEAATFAGRRLSAFLRLRGAQSVVPGYAGGQETNPGYPSVCTGTIGHAETVRIEFDPERISYADLLAVFFSVHDPTTLNRRVNDIGSQYRAAIFHRETAGKVRPSDADTLARPVGGQVHRYCVSESLKHLFCNGSDSASQAVSEMVGT